MSEVHAASHGRSGVRRVHAELTMGRGMAIGYQQIELLMRRAGIKGLTGRRKWRRMLPDELAADLVQRGFTRQEPNRLWVTDLTEHRTHEGKLFCCVVLNTFSRRVVGWSIDSSPTAALATNALGMAIDTRLGATPAPGTWHLAPGTWHLARSLTRTKACNSTPGPSPPGLKPLACFPPWARSGIATTTR
ncbi:DDE-type integrase/transposase/recombinase [Nesterenkonia sp. DZ6]|uniref:DDE-type integrase/transposase/recombinase n=1 Tax=Nesterenkonia sp. DZ6 TaxID=2901229 RepID=UPI00351CC8E5